MSSEPVASKPEAGSADTPASSLADELASEKKKCQQIWKELVQVGTSWEAQAKYIKQLETERARLNDALGEVYDTHRKLLQDLIDPDSPDKPADVVAQRFSLSDRPASLDVVLCFLIFYCRLPDSQKDIDHLLSRVECRGDLLEAFFTARETRQLYPTLVPYRLTGHEPALAIEQVESAETLKQFFENTKRVWSGFGDTEPHWSVITDDRYKASSIAEQKDSFYASGKWDAACFLKTLSRNGVDPGQISSFLDFGCGVGRLTINLKTNFKTLYGVDVSKGHLKLAEEVCQERGISNINWIHLDSLGDLAALPEVDAFYSRIVLQHNPPPVSQFILKNLLAKLNPGGVGFFQVPTYMEGYQFNIDPYLEASREATQMEMHPIPQSRIFRICEDENVRVLEVFEDQCCRDVEGISNTFVVQKRF